MYTFDGRIRYSEVDRTRRLTVEKTIDYFQDCSTFQSEDLGVGLDYMKARHCAWVINYWQIEFLRRPVLGEKVLIGTMPYEFKSILGMRNFWMETADGEKLTLANSVWSLLDMEKMYPMRIPSELEEKYKISPRLEMKYSPRKIAVPKEGGEPLEAIQVRLHHLDTNQHMNNAFYIYEASTVLPEGKHIRGIRTEYKAQALLGDTIYMKRCVTEDSVTVLLNKPDGDTYAVIRFLTKEEN